MKILQSFLLCWNCVLLALVLIENIIPCWSHEAFVPSTVGSFRLLNNNYRHGGAEEANSPVEEAPVLSSDIQKVLSELTNILISEEESSDNAISRENEAQLWKQLGKLCLDAGEFAEAYRIFRRGASRCPFDEGLCHYEKVFNTFHRDNSESREVLQSSYANEQDKTDPLLPLEIDESRKEDLFLSLDVPPEKIPKSILSMAKRNGFDSANPKLSHLLHASKEPVFSRDACNCIIQCAKTAAENRGGWTTDRHVHAPTCDIPIFDLESDAISWIRNSLKDVLFPLLTSGDLFSSDIGIEEKNLRVQDLFIVRYDGSDDNHVQNRPGFASLRPHQDESIISLTIALNDMAEYDGGGLFIACTGDLLNGDAGTVLTFAGELVHGGYPVQKGTRWIMTVFLYLDVNLSSSKAPGYILETIDKQVNMA